MDCYILFQVFLQQNGKVLASFDFYHIYSWALYYNITYDFQTDRILYYNY